jgi:hypothetical protein
VESYRLLSVLGCISAAEAGKLTVDPTTRTALGDALSSFVRHHVDGIRRLNVGGVMRDVLGPPASADKR